MIKSNKAKNAGIDPNSLVVRGLYYSIYDFFYLTHSNCGGGTLHSTPTPTPIPTLPLSHTHTHARAR